MVGAAHTWRLRYPHRGAIAAWRAARALIRECRGMLDG